MSSNNGGNAPLGPDPNEIGYDECIVEDEGSSGGSSSTSGSQGTYCDLDIVNNVWVEGVVDLAANKRGICMLDTMTREQVVQVLKHDPKAREDLCKVTSNAELLAMLDTVHLLRTDTLAGNMQKSSARTGLPFYNVFRGNAPNAQFFPKKKT